MKDSLAAIFSLEGPKLTSRMRAFFREAEPLGFILFSRNVENPCQLRALTDDLKDALGRNCPILIDQEGGRVQRLRPPHWRAYPAMKTFGDRMPQALPPTLTLPPAGGGESKEINPFPAGGGESKEINPFPAGEESPGGTGGGEARSAAKGRGETKGRGEENNEAVLEDLRYCILQMAEDLTAAGINVDCAPVLDVLTRKTDEVIGDRAFSDDPKTAARLGLSVCRNFLAAGITPVIKHMPGHGRAAADSHKTLPHVTASRKALERDFAPFKAVARSEAAPGIWGMVAHVVYTRIDPYHPASVSEIIIRDIIRGEIGFDGFLISDDLDMNALRSYGTPAARALNVVEAGCDAALYCSGRLSEMEKIAETVPKLSKNARRRLQNAKKFTKLAA